MAKGIHRYLSSDHNVFSTLYKSYYEQMVRIARYYVGNAEMAEDVVSDAFAKLWELRDELETIKDVRKFLFVMVKRKCLDELNKHSYKKRDDLDSTPPHLKVNIKNPETTYLNQELSERIEAALQKLPEKCRIVFLLVKEDKLRYKEVARQLNISEKTVEMHVGNALKALRKDLIAYAPPPKTDDKESSASIISILTIVILKFF